MVAVGYNGSIMTSPDGVNWISQNSGTKKDLTGVTWTGHLLVAVGFDPMDSNQPDSSNKGTALLTSPDGVTWTERNSGSAKFTASPLSVVWTGTQLVAVGFLNHFGFEGKLFLQRSARAKPSGALFP